MPLRNALMVATVIFIAGICCTCDKAVVKVHQPASQPTTQTAFRSFKGWELYAWQEGDAWQFSLLVGTNRNKTEEEIVATIYRLKDVAAVRAQLSELARGESVFFSPRKTGGPLPPKQVQVELEKFCKEHALQWDSPWGQR